MYLGSKKCSQVPYCSNVSTTPVTAMGCRQCLPLSVVQLKGKHCRKPQCRNGVVDTFGHYWVLMSTNKGLNDKLKSYYSFLRFILVKWQCVLLWLNFVWITFSIKVLTWNFGTFTSFSLCCLWWHIWKSLYRALAAFFCWLLWLKT